jgi:hypothetical protein
MEFVQDLLTTATQVIAIAGFGGIALHAIFKQHAKIAAIYAEVPHATPATKPQAEVEPVTEEPTEQPIIDEQPAIADPWELPITMSSRRSESRQQAQPSLYLLPPAKPMTPEIQELCQQLIEAKDQTDAALAALKEVASQAKKTRIRNTKKTQQNLEIDLNSLDSASLRKLCGKHGINWRNARGQGKHLTKAAMIFQLEQKATA